MLPLTQMVAPLPTTLLPPILQLNSYSLDQIAIFLNMLQTVYWPHPNAVSLTSKPNRSLHRNAHLTLDDGVTDSGYASTEEDEGDDEEEDYNTQESVELLRSNDFERDFAIRWLTGFVKRSCDWVPAPQVVGHDTAASNCNSKEDLVDLVTSLLAAFADPWTPTSLPDTPTQDALVRFFSFPTVAGEPVDVKVRDALLSASDHTCVGLQCWGAAIVLAEWMCSDPVRFFGRGDSRLERLRVLELGAGTGLLSIVAAKFLGQRADIVATDYHPSVLRNLANNIYENDISVRVCPLDWSAPIPAELHLVHPFDVVMGADLVYEPQHARWLHGCVSKVLGQNGVFWLIVTLRGTGRHANMERGVEQVFPDAKALAGTDGKGIEGRRTLAVVGKAEVGKKQGQGRADEEGYILYKIGWVTK